jgi:uncharacterized protein (DUF1800 family)
MSSQSDRRPALIALNRFGHGARGRSGDLARLASDPRGALKAELQQSGGARIEAPVLAGSQAVLQTVFAEQRRIRAERMMPPAEAASGPTPAPQQPARKENAVDAAPPPQQLFFRAEALARFQRGATAEIGFLERLVSFWSNHFCVSAAKSGVVRAIAGAFEREAIRPHVLGRFGDMLVAVAKHPAMLLYLDNARSFGPSSPAGRRRGSGLNENLAREILELHTLGVSGGYTQADVTALARILTGWTFAGQAGRIGEPGVFTFFPNGHEPGDHSVLGKIYRAGGIEQGEAALADLATHPATARHVAQKFAAHFVSDAPPQPLVERLESVFKATGGDLKALAVALVDADEAWSGQPAKLRSPYEFLLAAVRAVAERAPEEPARLLGPLNVMGMPLWQPPGPNGFPDTVAAWATASGVKARLDVASAIATRLRETVHPTELLDAVVGEDASRETRLAVSRAESRQQGLALVLMSPEFQWR